MLKNYLKIAYRNLLKKKVFSMINIMGLAIGMTACLLILQYIRFELSYEDFHVNADNIYRVTLDYYNGSEYVVTDCETYGPLGPLLKEQMPEVKDFVRFFHADFTEVKLDDKKFFEEKIYYADSTAFNVFTYDVLAGDPNTALSNPLQAVITKSTAQKYFGKTDVVGEAIQINNEPYKITAVIADLPPNTHLKFDFLLSHTTIYKLWSWYEKYAWNGNNEYTYLLMDPSANLEDFNKKLYQLSIDLGDKMDDDKLVAEHINDIHLYSHKTFEPEVNGNAKVVYFLLIIALFTIVIAWVNYVNLSTARAVERAREVGIRKVMGSAKLQLIFQFLMESALICLIAVGITLTILQLSLPLFRDIIGKPIPLDINSDPIFWYLLLGLLGFGTLVSGLYPALVLSSFQPISVLKGKLSHSAHGNWLRKGLVVFQFASTVVLIVCTCTVYMQINFLRQQDLGMNIQQHLSIHTPQLDLEDSLYVDKIASFKTELLRQTAVKGVTGSESLPGLSLHELSTSTGIRKVGSEEGKGYNYYIIRADADFVPVMGMQLIAGRNFDAISAQPNQVLINEEAVRMLGFSSAEEALGAQITYYYQEKPSTIIGVIKNYHQRSPKEKHIPMVFPYNGYASYLTLSLETEDIRTTMASIQDSWQQFFPNSAFDYFFLDDLYNQQYQADTQFGEVVGIFSTLAIIIACLGLFGLSSYTMLQRTKEIGIRKVLGASVTQILGLLSKEFIMLIIVASIIAIPIAWFATTEWLNSYASRISLSWWLFVIPFVLVLLIALLTVSFQTIKMAMTNPANTLRTE